MEGALAKLYRVLPLKSRERLQAISTHLTLSPHQQEARSTASLLVSISESVQEHRRIAIDYCSHLNQMRW